MACRRALRLPMRATARHGLPRRADADGVAYVVGVQSSIAVWARDDGAKPIKAGDLAMTLPSQMWKTVCWREGPRVILSRASLTRACGHRIATIGVPSPGPRSGC
jgi:hypothetical protein